MNINRSSPEFKYFFRSEAVKTHYSELLELFKFICQLFKWLGERLRSLKNHSNSFWKAPPTRHFRSQCRHFSVRSSNDPLSIGNC